MNRELKRLLINFSLILLSLVMIIKLNQDYSNFMFLTEEVNVFNSTIVINDYKTYLINNFHMFKDSYLVYLIPILLLFFALLEMFISDYTYLKNKEVEND